MHFLQNDGYAPLSRIPGSRSVQSVFGVAVRVYWVVLERSLVTKKKAYSAWAGIVMLRGIQWKLRMVLVYLTTADDFQNGTSS